MKRNHWTAMLLALLLFCCGAAVGALADRFYTARPSAQKRRRISASTIFPRRARSCNLTPAQVSQLEAILDDTKAKVKAVRDAYHPAMLKIQEEQISRVKSILRPEQIPAYEQLVAEHEQRAKEQEERDRERERKRAAARQQQTAP